MRGGREEEGEERRQTVVAAAPVFVQKQKAGGFSFRLNEMEETHFIAMVS